MQVGAMVAPTATSLFMTNITVIFLNKSIEVNFDTANYSYANYNIEVWNQSCSGLNGERVYQITAVGGKHVTKTVITGFFDPGDYCLQVTPYNVTRGGNCHTGCSTVKKDVYLNYPEPLNCRGWNATIHLDSISHQVLVVRVYIQKKYQKCFSSLNVSLWVGAKKRCDALSGSVNDSAIANTSQDTWSEVKFENLVPGSYCVRVYGRHKSCNGYCDPVFSYIKNLTGETPLVEEPKVFMSLQQQPETSHGLTWLYVGLPCCATVFLGLGYFIYRRKCKTRITNHNDEIGNINQEKNLYQRKNAVTLLLDQKVKDVAENKEVVLVAFHDFAKLDDFINALYRFLKDFLGFKKVRLDLEEEHDIPVDPAIWVDEVTKEQENRCFIILESEDAIKRVEERKGLIVSKEDEDYLNLLFFRALQNLEGDTRGICAYKNFFVVKFEAPTSKNRLNLVPLRRFHLPKFFVDLLESVLDLQDHNLKAGFGKYAEEKWIESQEWKDLQECMRKAQETVRDNRASNTFTEIVV